MYADDVSDAIDHFYFYETDLWLGQISGADFYMSYDQFEYWWHMHLTVDVAEGRGASFPL